MTQHFTTYQFVIMTFVVISTLTLDAIVSNAASGTGRDGGAASALSPAIRCNKEFGAYAQQIIFPRKLFAFEYLEISDLDIVITSLIRSHVTTHK